MRQLNFRNSSLTVNVICICSLGNENDLNENFIVSRVNGIKGHPEIKLFYWLVKGLRYTLNEFIFFAVCNGLCIYVSDQNGVFIKSYGTCAGALGDFNNDFNNDFFK